MGTAQFFGRAFEVEGHVILPCWRCGTPMWPYAPVHECIGLLDKELAEWIEDE
jgi:hypothetical protein